MSCERSKVTSAISTAGFRFTATSRRSISHHSLDRSLNMSVEEVELEEKREAHAARMAKMVV